jgi:hypothetical protein
MPKPTADNTVGVLRQAAAVVEEAQLADDLRPIAFARVLDLTLGGASQAGPDPSADQPRRTGATRRAQADASDPVGALAAKLKLDADAVERVFDFHGDGVQLTVATSDLAESQSEATGEVAYLITAALQASGLKDEVPIQTIKEACEDRGVLDAPNFARAMSKIEGKGISKRGAGKHRAYKINARGYEIAAKIVERIIHASE